MRPVDVATQHTIGFILKQMELAGAQVLEVGCGRGHLAAEMTMRGADVLAIDNREDAATAARQHGVNARQCDLLEFEMDGPSFDAIVCIRSLHHIHPVATAVSKAHSLLKNGGLLIVEDFAAEKADERSLRWLKISFESLPASETRAHEDGHQHAFPVNSVAEWNKHHFEKHKVADSTELESSVRGCFENVQVGSCPYLYRYLIDKCRETDQAGLLIEDILEHENIAIDSEWISAIGLRIVARK